MSRKKEFLDVYETELVEEFHDKNSTGMFETYGKELQYILDFINKYPDNIKRVWTLLDVNGRYYRRFYGI